MNNILLISITGVVSSILTALVMSYIREKGKNLATKEDVAEITRLIETEKYSHTRKNEHHQDVKKALLEFYDVYLYWIEVQLSNEIWDIDENNIDEYSKHEKHVEESHKKVIALHYRTGFLLYDKPLYDLMSSLISKAYDIQIEMGFLLIRLRSIYPELNKAILSEMDQLEDELNKKADNYFDQYDKKYENGIENLEKELEEYLVRARKIVYGDI